MVTHALAVSSSSSKFCPPSPLPSSPLDYTLTVTVKGSVVDSAGHGVNGVNVSGSVTGGGAWVVHTQSGDTFQGNATPSLKNASVTTDCNGNFSFEVKVAISVTFNQGSSGNEDTQWYNMGISPLTLSLSSGSLQTVNSILTFNEFISSEECNYELGRLL